MMEPSGSNPSTAAKVRVVLFGVGSVASAALDLCRRRPWIEVAGAVRRPAAEGGAVRPSAPAWQGVEVWEDPDEMLEQAAPEAALIATRSPLGEVLPDIERCARRGVRVVCTSEELAWPDVERPGEAGRLERLAADAGTVIAAAGINPGFVFDAVPLALAGAAWGVDRILIQRILDASVFGRTVHRSLGVGCTEDEFRRAAAERRVRGHIGFPESARALAAGFGLEIDRYEERVEPIPAEQVHELAEYTIRPPETAGASQLAAAWVGGREWLRFELSLHVDPGAAGWEVRDRIRIYGENEIDLTIRPGLSAVLTTSALLVNTLPAALRARPGFYPAAGLMPASPWLAEDRPPGPGSQTPGTAASPPVRMLS